MAEILTIRRKTLFNQSINLSTAVSIDARVSDKQKIIKPIYRFLHTTSTFKGKQNVFSSLLELKTALDCGPKLGGKAKIGHEINTL